MTKMEILQEVINSLRTVLTDDGIVSWLDKPVKDLNWATPIEAINMNNGRDVLQVVDSYHEFVY